MAGDGITRMAERRPQITTRSTDSDATTLLAARAEALGTHVQTYLFLELGHAQLLVDCKGNSRDSAVLRSPSDRPFPITNLIRGTPSEILRWLGGA